MLVLSVDIVRSFSGFIRSIKKPGVFRIPQQKLANASVSASDRDMNWCVSSLRETKRRQEGQVRRARETCFDQTIVIQKNIMSFTTCGSEGLGG